MYKKKRIFFGSLWLYNGCLAGKHVAGGKGMEATCHPKSPGLSDIVHVTPGIKLF